MAYLFKHLGHLPKDANKQAIDHMLLLTTDGFLFGACLLACDPSVSPRHWTGSIFYGLLIGIFAVLIRCMASYPYSTMMSAILLGNMFAPLFDSLVPSLKPKDIDDEE
jgi:Na+-transporting NADH:ubiquinone oxidoreductase subunit B